MKDLIEDLMKLGEMIQCADEWGNDHIDRKAQWELFKEIKSQLNNLPLPSHLQENDGKIYSDVYADADVTRSWNRYIGK